METICKCSLQIQYRGGVGAGHIPGTHNKHDDAAHISIVSGEPIVASIWLSVQLPGTEIIEEKFLQLTGESNLHFDN